MQRVYTIGETVYDIIFKNNQPIKAVAGGAMLNTSVSLGRLDVPVFLISEYGKDMIGDYINSFLIDNGVGIKYISRFTGGQSALAVAFLDDNNEASYEFYKNYPDERLIQKLPDVEKNDIVLFGSFYSLQKAVHKKIIEFVKEASERGAVIIYDPNIRLPHKDRISEYKDFIYENIKYSHIVRTSDEDIFTIFNVKGPERSFSLLKKMGCNILIYTINKRGVWLITDKMQMKYKVPQINPVSTIGAGDSFNAGIIYALIINDIKHALLSEISDKGWKKIIEKGIDFARDVCLSFDNYISEEFVKSIKV